MVSVRAAQAQVNRILGSRCFAGSERLSRFLRFVVEAALAGRGDQLKEYVIGVEVFDRKSSYDPRLEPIVRVEARRLRAKLKKFYDTDGCTDPVWIELPKGSYAPLIRRREATAPAPAPVEAAAPGSGATIAVLPFVNRSPNPDNDYFSDGLTEELIHALTKVEGLRVVGWPTAFRFKQEPRDLRGIGEQLHVKHLLEGSVRSASGRLRITAQLIELPSGIYLWSETYERGLEDVFAVQEEIARAIVSALRLQLIGTAAAPSISGRTPHLEAYQHYLAGRFHWNQRSFEGLRQAVASFDRALAIDGAYAAAHAGLADACIVLGEWGNETPFGWMERARAAARRALELDASLADAHTSLAMVHAVYDWDWDSAAHHFGTAIELSPNYATARHWYAYDYLLAHARFAEALEQVDLALESDPLSHIICTAKGSILSMQRRHDEALRQYRGALELSPGSYRPRLGLARTYVDLGRHDEALAILESVRSDFPITLALIGHAYASAGRLHEANAVLARLDEQARHSYVPAYAYARIHLAMPDKEVSIDWLEKAALERESRLIHLNVAPIYDPLRGNPRFTALAARINLPANRLP